MRLKWIADARDSEHGIIGYVRELESPQNKVCVLYDGDDDQIKSRAHLISAAPEMLETLELILADHNDGTACLRLERVKSAIAKAKGESA